MLQECDRVITRAHVHSINSEGCPHTVGILQHILIQLNLLGLERKLERTTQTENNGGLQQSVHAR